MSLLLISCNNHSWESLLGKFLFKNWFNHLTLYCIILGGSIFLYELKLLPYVEVNSFRMADIIASSFYHF